MRRPARPTAGGIDGNVADGPAAAPGDLQPARRYYEQSFHRQVAERTRLRPTGHLRRLARRIGAGAGDSLLDVACGAGGWLAAVDEAGAEATGLDLSCPAVCACRDDVPTRRALVGDARRLPFHASCFDLVSCLGALEHLSDPLAALREMVRVGRPDATFLLLVPNSRFLGRTLGGYGGTEQTALRETPRTAEAWTELFAAAGLRTIDRWRDLHVISWRWIGHQPTFTRLVRRTLTALLLPLLPTRLQYQIYFRCVPVGADGPRAKAT